MVCFVHFDFERCGLITDAAAFLCRMRIEIQRLFTHIAYEVQRLIGPASNHAHRARNFKTLLDTIDIDWVDFAQAKPQRHDQQQRFPCVIFLAQTNCNNITTNHDFDEHLLEWYLCEF